MRILVSDPIASEGVDILKEEFQVDVKTGLTEDELVYIIEDYDALIVRSSTKVTKRIIENANRLKVIGRAGVGVDNIDVEAATFKGILVVNAPEGNTIAAAEHTMAMMLSLSRKIPQATMSLKRGHWDKKAFMGVEVKGKTLGIIGLGRIGREVGKRARAFHMNVISYDPYISQENIHKDEIKMVDLDTLLRNSDFITLHAPLTSSTNHIIGEKEFKILKKGVRIINCARGGLIDENALYNSIIEGRVAGASLDVFEKEPATNNKLLKLDQVIATPHLGASTEEAQINVSIDIANDVIRALNNKTVRNAVNMMSIKPEEWAKIHHYVLLAEKLGKFYSQFRDGRVRRIEMGYSGGITELNTSILTASALKGLLNVILQEPVNLVNALVVTKERKIEIIETKKRDVDDYSNLITLKVISDNYECLVGGTVFGKNDQRIVMINKYKIDLIPEGNIILISHRDKPGMIGSVGTILGRNDINIATMQVGRMSPRGEAIMALTVDEYVNPQIIKEIADTEGIEEVKFIVF